jgi:hypothetical protein
MNESMEIAGDVLAQAVVAHEIGKSLDDGAQHAASCANCGAALTGPYCHQCGQRAHVHRSLLHMVEELLHGIFHFETKAWRTLLPLLFRPGRLTREYIEGRRVRYVAPLPLFLFMMFAMFMVFSFVVTKEAGSQAAQVGAQGREQAKQAGAELKALRAEMAALPASDPRRAADEEKAQELEAKVAALTWLPSMTQEAKPEDKTDGTGNLASITQEQLHVQLLKGAPWLAQPGFEHKILHALQNKELALYKIKSGAAKFAILLVPITLPFLWLLFAFRRQFKMFDHAVFAFYSLSAMAVWISLVTLLDAVRLEGTAALVGFVAPPVHMFAQLRGAYALSRWAAAWRTLALLLYAGLALLAYFLIVILVSM